MPIPRLRLYQFLSLMLGFCCIGIAELSLRWTGQYNLTSEPPALPEDWDKGGISAAANQSSKLLKTGQSVVELTGYAKGYMKTPNFNITADKKRIFSFGGSATLGVPVENNPKQTFPGQLGMKLKELGIEVESINLGGASFGSDHVRQLTEEVNPFNASALVVYSGNNEYFNFGLALTERNRNYKASHVYLQSLHLFRLLQHLLGHGPTALTLDPIQLKFEQDKQLAVIIQGLMQHEENEIQWDNGRVVRNDQITKQVSTRYKSNLQSTIDSANGAIVLIGEVPPNLFEPPWLSLHRPSLSIAKRESFKSRITTLREQPCEVSLNSYESLVQLDNWRADAWYELGLCQYELGLPYEKALRNALDLDMNPGRPTTALSSTLTELKNGEIVRFDAFQHSTDFGRDYFHDSCHLTPEGYSAVAQSFRNALIARGWGL